MSSVNTLNYYMPELCSIQVYILAPFNTGVPTNNDINVLNFGT